MDSGGGTAAAPTWSHIYGAYMAHGTIGHCVDCHAAQAGDADSAYAFLQTAGYIDGTQSTVSSVFGWMGGFMPPGTTTSRWP